MPIPLYAQLINLLAALLLLLAFAMLAQRRMLSLVNLFAAQGARARRRRRRSSRIATGQPHLYCSAALTLALKVMLLPWLLHRLIRKLDVQWDIEPLINIPATMLVGIVLVIFAFNLAQPISQLASTVTRSTLGIALASVHALVPDDDHAAQGDVAGDRLPVDGERPVLRRDQRHLRHADGRRARRRARRAGRHARSSACSSSRSASSSTASTCIISNRSRKI